MRWIPIYRHKERFPESEAWACTGCGAQENRSHQDGPSNGLCKCDRVIIHIPTRAYLTNYDQIKWDAKRNG